MYLPQRFQNSVKLNDSKGNTILIIFFCQFQNSVKLNDSKGSNRFYTMRENKKLIEQTCVGNRNCRGQ